MDGDWFSTVVWLLFFIVMMYLYPRLLITQTLLRLDQAVQNLAILTSSAKEKIIRKIKRKDRKLRERIENFLEFFVISPVDLDPFGIVRKLEHLINLEISRFKYFVNSIAPNLSKEERANLMMGIASTMNLYQLMKVLRHYVEFIKKTRNVQLALLLQMQLPIIERASKALYKGIEAFINGWAIGDGVGPLVVSSLIKEKPKEIEEDTIVSKEKIAGRKVLILKPKGPGGRLGKIGNAAEKLVRKYKIDKIITIDASVKLEGEKTGTIAEGIGVAIGGIGVDKFKIEEIATKHKIPVDSYVIKMSDVEAIIPMKIEILRSIDKIRERVIENIKNTKTKNWILVIGVGNTCGIGNSLKEYEKTKERIKKIYGQLLKKGYYKEKMPRKWYELMFSG